MAGFKQTPHLKKNYSKPETSTFTIGIQTWNVITFANNAKTILRRLTPQALNVSILQFYSFKIRWNFDGNSIKL